MKVLMSIKPEFAEKIFNGTKKFEFRRSIFKNKNVKRVIVYASSPVQKVIGEFEIGAIIDSDLETLWNQTSAYSGISKEYFDSYFDDKKKGFAIKVKKIKKYSKPLCIRKNFKVAPPQSFLYLR